MNVSRRQWLRAASGLFVAAPIAHSIFAPRFGAWFRQLFRRPSPWKWDDAYSGIWSRVYPLSDSFIVNYSFEMTTEIMDLLKPEEGAFGRYVERSHVFTLPPSTPIFSELLTS